MESNASDFTTGSIPKKLIKFMIPILGALILQAMYGAVDVLVVGQFGTKTGISGVSTGSSIVNFVIFTIAGLSMGITVLIGRYLGEKREERVGKVIGGAIFFFAVLSVLIAAVMLIFARPFALAMQAPAEAVDATATYVRICGGGIFFIIAYNVISSIFRGLGNSKLPLIFVAIACVTNIAGDLLFVAVFHMDVAGAALATVLAQAVSVVLSVIIIRRQKLPFKLTRADIGFNEEIKIFFGIGSPIALQEILTEISFMALCAFINRLGLDESSGYGVANKIVSFVMLIPGALMQSMSSFISQNVGAGKESRAKRAMFTGMVMGAVVGIFVSFFTFVKGDVLSGIFSGDRDVILRSAEYLKGFSIEAIVTCVLFSFIGYFNGHGKTLFVMAQGMAQTFLVRLPVSYIMSIQKDASLTYIGMAAPLATIFGIAINTIYYAIYTGKMKKLQKVTALVLVCILTLTGCGAYEAMNRAQGTDRETAYKTSEETEKESIELTDTLEVHFIDIGQGDCTLIKCGGQTMLIDAGNNNKGTTVELYLRKQGVEKLDYVIGTHPDADHIGGLDVVIYHFDCGMVLLPNCEKNTKTYEELIQTIETKYYKITRPVTGDTYRLGEAEFTIVSPVEENYGNNANNYSIGIRLTFGNTSFLFTGDAEEEAEEDMLESGINLDADVYKVSHHGSRTASTEEFMNAVTPKYAVISCGEGNSYGHPHAEVLNRLRGMGVHVFRTDEQGVIVAKSDGNTITFNCSPSESWQAGES